MSAAEALPSEEPSPWRDTTAILGPITPELVAACPVLDPANRQTADGEHDAQDFLALLYEARLEQAWMTWVEERTHWPQNEPDRWD
jgi:hypothetical protein